MSIFDCSACGKPNMRDFRDDYMLTEAKWKEVTEFYSLKNDRRTFVCYRCLVRALPEVWIPDFTICLCNFNRVMYSDMTSKQIVQHMHGHKKDWPIERQNELAAYADQEIVKVLNRRRFAEFEANSAHGKLRNFQELAAEKMTSMLQPAPDLLEQISNAPLDS